MERSLRILRLAGLIDSQRTAMPHAASLSFLKQQFKNQSSAARAAFLKRSRSVLSG